MHVVTTGAEVTAPQGNDARPLRRGERVLRWVDTDPGRGVLCFLIGLVGMYVALRYFVVAEIAALTWYPLAGVYTVLAVRWGPARPLWLGILTGAVAGALVAGVDISLALGGGLANVLELLAFCLVYRWLRGGPQPLGRPADIARLTASAILAVTLSAAVVFLPWAVLGRPPSGAPENSVIFQYGIWGFWAAHLTGILVVCPVVLALLDRPVRPQPRPHQAEYAAHLVILVTLSLIVYAPWQTLPITFLVGLPPLWSAARLGMTWTGMSILLSATIVLGRVAAMNGDPSVGVSPLVDVTVNQMTVVVIALTAMTLALLAQRRDALTRQIERSEALWRTSFNSALTGMALFPLQPPPRPVTAMNDALRQIIGDQGVIEWFRTFVPADQKRMREVLVQLERDEIQRWQGDVQSQEAAGARWFSLSLAVLPTVGRGPNLVTAQILETTSRHRAEASLRNLALHDPLTGLPNRTLVYDRIELALAANVRAHGQVSVLFCDIDNFKNINDSAGHAVGDALLVELSGRIRASVRPGDTVGRIGGDEFVVVCPDLGDPQEAIVVAERIRVALAAPSEGTDLGLTVGVSIGVAFSGPRSTAQSLLREADTAMYSAKRSGRNRVAVFDAADHERVVRTVRLERELSTAVREGQFVLHYQPVVSLPSGRLEGVEALVRWNHPGRGLLPPGEWLDVAEDSRLMPELGTWILEEATRQAAQWHGRWGEAAPFVHVNISPAQLRPGFDERVAQLLERFGLPGELLVLELTEQQFDRPTASLLGWFETLRPSGVQLAIDDFGTGYNSLTHVTDLSVDVIKLDRQFVSAMHHDDRAMAVVQAVIGMSQALDLAVVAEGVEIRRHAAELRDLGCRWGQGFLWSAALPPEDVELLIETGPGDWLPDGEPGASTAGDPADRAPADRAAPPAVTDLRDVADRRPVTDLTGT